MNDPGWLDDLDTARRIAADPGARDSNGRLIHRPGDRREFAAAAASLRAQGLNALDVAQLLELSTNAVRDLWYEVDHDGRERCTASAGPSARAGARL